MDTTPARSASPEAKAAFAELLARVEAGETLDFEAEFRTRAALAPELRQLHASWRRLQGAFDALEADSSALESAEDEARAQHAAAPDAALRAELLVFEEQRYEQRYEARGRIGRGGMGVVQRVYDRVLQREVAAKHLRRGRASSSRRFLAEARLAASLDHPGIVPVLDAGLDARGRPWFTMPLLSGTNLGVVLSLARDERNGWTRTRALGVLLQVCETVAYAHARGIVHRDLKPANVMVGSFGEVHVLDWGLAFLAQKGAEPSDAVAEGAVAQARNAREHQTRHGALLGTPAYMPPEQAAGRRELVGPACDVYALGAILYHLLSGRAPYAEIGASNDAVARALLAGPPIALALVAPQAPGELVAIAEKAMARDQEQRYASMRELADDLRACVEGRVVRAHESGAWAELRKWIGRNRVLAGALGVIALLGAFALGFVAWSARAQHAELLRLADARRLADLVAREEQLYPTTHARFPELELWLAEANALAARLAVHRRDLAALRSTAELTSEEDAWRRDALTALVNELEGLANPSTGLIARTRARLERGRLVEEESLVHHRADWDTAIATIAAPAGPYGGLHLAPQAGLIPLGRDPESGLECFADLASGRAATRDAANAFVIAAESGLVFVLVPGGSSWFGSSGAVVVQGSGEIADAWARDHELPRRRVELAPYFLAKYELTQAQWSRLAGTNPSYLPLAAAANPASRGLHPLDTVSWEECTRALARAGLALPTEAQWENAARAGSVTPWWCGADASCLAGRVNAALASTGTETRESWPVDSGAPNAWGFHDILGNVAEWTRDVYVPDHAGQLRAGDGEAQVEGEGSRLRVVRGGSFLSPAPELRCSARDEQSLGTRSAWIGLRPARAVDP